MLNRGAADILSMYRSTNAQQLQIFNTRTDASNGEWGLLGWGSNVFNIGTTNNGTGTGRDVQFVQGGTSVFKISGGNILFNTDDARDIGALSSGRPRDIYMSRNLRVGGFAQFTGNFYVGPGGAQATFTATADGVLKLSNAATTDFGRLMLGGNTSSFPAVKRNGTGIDIVLANDTGFTAIRGKLTTDTAYAAGAPAPTGYLTLFDVNGTAYKVPAVAA